MGYRGANGFLFDCSNLHRGGGVQVGASLINELAVLAESEDPEGRLIRSLDLLVSPEVAASLELAAWTAGLRIQVGSSSPRGWAKLPNPPYEAIFTVFGPTYRRRHARLEIVGFALGLLIYPLVDVGLQPPTLKERILNRVRWARFRSADVLVTETPDSAERVSARVPHAKVEVVPNCVSDAVADRSVWRYSSNLSRLDPEVLYLAVVARDNPHKNLQSLPSLGAALEARLGRTVRFVVTLTDEEWAGKGDEFARYCINCGVLDQRELGFLYESCAASVVPSLLEISSAAPLESLSLGIPVFISDLPAMRSAYGEAAIYYNSRDAASGAAVIAQHLTPDALDRLRPRCLEWSREQPVARQRARRYLEILAQRQSTQGTDR